MIIQCCDSNENYDNFNASTITINNKNNNNKQG